MSCIVYQKNKKTGVVYAYESESYRDPVTKKPKSKRKYLGRVDPETKAIIPKSEEPGKRNRSGTIKTYQILPDNVSRELNNQKKQIQELQAKVVELSKKNQESSELIEKMKQLLENYG